MYLPARCGILADMGLLRSGAETQTNALAGFDSPALESIREQARGAQLANRKTFVVRLPLPPEDAATVGEVRFWAAAVQQVGQHGWALAGWSVVPEPSGTVAYATFARA